MYRTKENFQMWPSGKGGYGTRTLKTLLHSCLMPHLFLLGNLVICYDPSLKPCNTTASCKTFSLGTLNLECLYTHTRKLMQALSASQMVSWRWGRYCHENAAMALEDLCHEDHHRLWRLTRPSRPACHAVVSFSGNNARASLHGTWKMYMR